MNKPESPASHLTEVSERDRVICGVISEVQNQLRGLRALAHYGIANDEDGAEHILLLTEGVTARLHQMLDSLLEVMGETRAGNFENAFVDEARAMGIDHAQCGDTPEN